jgi:DNA-binding SARP family transcriptional activator
MQSPFADFTVGLVEAEISCESNRIADGLGALRIALSHGKAGAYMTTPLWEPQAVSALLTRALDEGIETEYVQRLIQYRRLTQYGPAFKCEAWPWPTKIYVCGRLEVTTNGQRITFSRKAQRKPLELLKAVVALSIDGRARESRLIDALWPDAEGDAGRFALTTTLHRLRRLLGDNDVVVRQDDQIGLNPRFCWVDVWGLQSVLDRAESIRGDSGDDWPTMQRCADTAATLYRGSLMESGGTPGWAQPMDSSLRRRVVTLMIRVARQAQQLQQRDVAANYFERALTIDPSDRIALTGLAECC